MLPVPTTLPASRRTRARATGWWAAAIALVAVLGAAMEPRAEPTTWSNPVAIGAEPVPMDHADAEATTIGRLRWRGGLALSARDSRTFGGWSALRTSDDGKKLWAISDEGAWLTASLRYDSRGHLSGIADGRIGPLRGEDGKPLRAKRDADAESLARLPDGSWLVGFEQRHRILRYPPGEEPTGGGLAGVPMPVAAPPGLERAPSNGGLEAMVATADGTLVLITEELSDAPGTVVGWTGRWTAAGARDWASFRYVPAAGGFRPTAIATLPDGDFVVLERAYSLWQGVRIRVMRIRGGQIAPGASVVGEELAKLASPNAVDNFEGVATGRGSRGETLLWLLSDDNFSPLQRTLLLMFELLP